MPVFEIVLHAAGALLLLAAGGGLDLARETRLTATLAAATAGPGVVFCGYRREDDGATHVWTFSVPASSLTVPAREPADDAGEDDGGHGAPAPAEALRVLRDALRLAVLDLAPGGCADDLQWCVRRVPATETP